MEFISFILFWHDFVESKRGGDYEIPKNDSSDRGTALYLLKTLPESRGQRLLKN